MAVDSKKSVFKAGAYVYIEGDEDSSEIFIVEKGQIELKSINENIKKYKTVIKAGEVFGFTSSLCRKPRMESAIARRESVVVAIKREKFIDLVRNNPQVAIKIINYFAEELRAYNDMMFSLEEPDQDLLPDSARLFNMGESYHKKGENAYAHYILQKYLEMNPRGDYAVDGRRIMKEIELTDSRFITEPLRNGVYKVFGDRQMIFSEFEPGEELYIIKEGKVKIIRVANDQEILLSVLKEGDIFGELSIVSNKPRNATAVSWGKSVLLPIRKETLTQVLEKSPGIINRIFMAISQRIWFTYIRVETKVYRRPITRIYVFLENKLLEDRVPLKSSKPVTFNFGIDELLRMAGLPPNPAAKTMDLLLEDSNLNFNFGKIEVENPSVLSTKAKFYRSRDHLAIHDEEPAAPRKERAAAPPPAAEMAEKIETPEEPREKIPAKIPEKEPVPAGQNVGLDPQELRVPSDEIDIDF